MAEVPQDRKYLPSHEWAQSVDQLVVVGISEFAAEELGELVYIELPKEGSLVKFDTSFGEIESVKAVSELSSPVTGTVVGLSIATILPQSLLHTDHILV